MGFSRQEYWSGWPLPSPQWNTAAAAAAKLLQSCPTLCDPRDSSPPGSPVHGILQARILEWVAISFSTMQYYSAIKKNEIMPFAATRMDLESVILNEVSQRRRNIIWHPLYVESKKKWYKWTYKTTRLWGLAYGCQGEGWGKGIVREFGMDMYTLLYWKWITNKDLLYSTENYIQYPMINHKGKEFLKKECLYIYVYLNHFAMYQKWTQHCKSTSIRKGPLHK